MFHQIIHHDLHAKATEDIDRWALLGHYIIAVSFYAVVFIFLSGTLAWSLKNLKEIMN